MQTYAYGTTTWRDGFIPSANVDCSLLSRGTLEGHYFWMGSCGSCNEMTKRVVRYNFQRNYILYAYVSLVLKEIESTL